MLFAGRFEVKVVDWPNQVPGHVQLVFNEGLVDDDLAGHIRQFGLSPGLHLFSHGLEIPLHAIDAHGDGVQQGERLRMLGKDRSKRAYDDCADSRQLQHDAASQGPCQLNGCR